MPALSCKSTMADDCEAPPARIARILVADDHDVVCAGIERMIAAQPDMEVCGATGNGTEAVEKARDPAAGRGRTGHEYDRAQRPEATREIRHAVPACEVLLFTGLETDTLIREAFMSGVKSFILKSDAQVHLLSAIRSLIQHRPYFTSAVSEVIFARMLHREREQKQDKGAEPGRFAADEIEIVRCLALGDGNRELARKLGVNLRTAEGRRAALMRKMNFESLADLVRYAVRNGIIEM